MLRLANSLIFKLVNGLVENVLRFVVLVVAARMMTKDGFGLYSYVINFAFLAVALANLGLPTATAQNISAMLLREKDQSKAKGVLSLAVWLRLMVTLIAAVAFMFASPWLQQNVEKENQAIWLLAASILIFKSFDVWLEYVFASLHKYRELFLCVTLPRGLFRAFLIGLLVWAGFSSSRLVAVESSVLALSMIMAGSVLFMHFRKIPRRGIAWQPFIGFALSIAPTSVISLAYERVNVMILGQIYPMSLVAEYNAAYQFTALAILLIPFGTVAVLPTFMALDSEQLNAFVNMIIRVSLVLILPVFFGLQVFGKELLTLLYGDRYIDGSAILGVFAFLLLERVLSPIMQNVLLALNRPKVITFAMTIGGIVNIVLAIWLVRIVGVIGPAIALVMARFLVIILLCAILATDGFDFQYWKFTLITAVASVLLFEGMWLENVVDKTVVFVVGVALYCFVMGRFIVPDDATYFNNIVGKHRHNWRSLLASA